MAREAQLQLLSRYENIELAEQLLAELGRDGDVERETLYWVGMALREALANAIKHGNKLNPDKRVFVEMRIVPAEEIVIAIEDEGEGFDPAVLADPTDGDNVLRASGRGVFYMKSFMDNVEFRQTPGGGTRIELSKRLVPRRQA